MELSEKTARDMIAHLVQNNQMLPRDIFNYRNEMHTDVATHIRKAFSLIREELLSFLKTSVKDIVCYGPVCSAVHTSTSIINVAFVIDTGLPDETLQKISNSLPKRGFVFKVYDHPLLFHLLKPKDITFANWSVMRNTWNQEPVFQNFKYDLDFLFEEYAKLNNDFHNHLDNLPKNAAGIYVPESCAVIKKYFADIEQKAMYAKEHTPEGEYSLEYNLLLALDVFKVREHFNREIIKSECYYIERGEDENV